MFAVFYTLLLYFEYLVLTNFFIDSIVTFVLYTFEDEIVKVDEWND